MTAEVIDARIKRLPPLPLVASKLLEVMRNDDCSAADITAVISTDQALASQVLKLANSSFYGLSGKVGSLPRAVVILGFSAIRSMALSLGLAATIKKAAGDSDQRRFWDHAIHVAAAGRALARQGGKVDPDEVFVAGLLHDLGSFVLELDSPGYLEQLAGVGGADILAAETRLLGMSHTKAGQKLMRHWKLPESLAQTVRFHHHPTQWESGESPLIAYVVLGDLLARVLGRSWEPVGSTLDPIAVAASVGVSLRQTGELIETVTEEVKRTRDFLQVAEIDLPGAATDDRHAGAGAGADDSPRRKAVVVSSDAECVGWLAGQLTWHGWAIQPMREFLAAVDQRANLVLVDARTVLPAQAAKLEKMLADRVDAVGLFGANGSLAGYFPGSSPLPAAFDAVELAGLAG